MNIKINEKDYELHFGLDFMRYLNKHYGFEQQGKRFELAGLNELLNYLEIGEFTALPLVVKAGLSTSKEKPSNQEVDQYIEEKTVELYEDGDDIFDFFLEQLEKSPFMRVALEKAQKENAKLKAQQAQSQQSTNN